MGSSPASGTDWGLGASSPWVNYAGNQGQCYVRLPFDDLFGHTVRLQDRMISAVYDRNSDDLVLPGLYLDMPPWGCHVFNVTVP